MKVITAPEGIMDLGPSVFLAGGITNCSDWQSEIIEKLTQVEKLTIYNPRRPDFPIGDPMAAYDQIKWEWIAMRQASSILFWFAPETLNPIVLFELGAHSRVKKQGFPDKDIFVGTHPDYSRSSDVRIQMKLEQPNLEIVHTLDDLAMTVMLWARRQ